MPTLERNQPAPGEFYLLMPDTTRRGRGHGVEIENEDALLMPPRLIIRPEEGGFPHLAQRPRLVLDPRLGDPPQDL
ncbi:imm11 family protein, partial [Enterobacter hormaechei]